MAETEVQVVGNRRMAVPTEEPAYREDGVMSQAARLHDRVERLRGAVARAHERFGPVCRLEPTPGFPEESPLGGSGLAENLDRAGRELDALIHSVNQLIESCDL